MAFDFKKEYKEFYLPAKTPSLVEIPPMNYLAVRGRGNPNQEGGAYHQALELLYGMAYTIKMSYKGPRSIEGFFAYVVPPLEGLWWQEGPCGIHPARKEDFHWISLIRLPDFVQRPDFEWAAQEAAGKKKRDFSPVEFFTYHEGLCVQCMHLGPYDDEPATVLAMGDFAAAHGYERDLASGRYHHEIYLGDPRKTAPDKLKTVIRHPIQPAARLADG